MPKIKIGFSPCPNDTFIFDALAHQRINTDDLDFEVVMADIEELNRMAFQAELEVTKLSFHAYMHLTDKYALLHSGSALGQNCGPLLIGKRNFTADEIKNAKIAIPGEFTTANFLLDFAFPEIGSKEEMRFNQIENAVLQDEVDLGLIIHENRFTYADKGLVSIQDLGEFWESKTGYPIPLGGIAVRRDIDMERQQLINRCIHDSITFAFEHPEQSLPFVKEFAQEMKADVMRSHIDLYVNEYSKDLGIDGRSAVLYMYRTMVAQGRISETVEPLFVNI